MGKTVPTYRMAVEEEIAHWKPFREALASDEEKQAFDDVADMCRNMAMAGGSACNPILFEPMVMSILLGQQKRMKTLQRKIDALLVATLPVGGKETRSR
jgi:hypothetical protein